MLALNVAYDGSNLSAQSDNGAGLNYLRLGQGQRAPPGFCVERIPPTSVQLADASISAVHERVGSHIRLRYPDGTFGPTRYLRFRVLRVARATSELLIGRSGLKDLDIRIESAAG